MPCGIAAPQIARCHGQSAHTLCWVSTAQDILTPEMTAVQHLDRLQGSVHYHPDTCDHQGVRKVQDEAQESCAARAGGSPDAAPGRSRQHGGPVRSL